jgi:hypothetical protein
MPLPELRPFRVTANRPLAEEAYELVLEPADEKPMFSFLAGSVGDDASSQSGRNVVGKSRIFDCNRSDRIETIAGARNQDLRETSRSARTVSKKEISWISKVHTEFLHCGPAQIRLSCSLEGLA